MDNAFKYIKANKGLDTEASYPYQGKNEPCRYKDSDIGATDTGKWFLSSSLFFFFFVDKHVSFDIVLNMIVTKNNFLAATIWEGD